MTQPHEHSPYSWLTRLAFGTLLAIVAARCLMLEVVREGLGGENVSGPGAATSMLLSWLTFVPMVLLLARRLVDPDFVLRFRWVHLSFATLALWTLASTAWASDRYLALVGGMQILAGASLFWSVSQLVRRWEHLRIVVGLCVGLLLANVLQAVLYRAVDLPDLQAYFQQNKAQIFADHGWQPGEFVATRFEQKIMAGELLGFNASPNTYGAVVVLLTLIALGAAMQRAEDRDDQGWVGVMFVAALASLYPLAYTGSKASWGALLLGIALLAFWRLTRRWLALHRGFVFAVAISGVLLAIVSVIAVGLSTGGLPEDSLNFRWRYWTAAWAGFSEAPVRGWGWGNFASLFLEHRLPASAEEINDPHNFLVRWASELGIVGLTLGAAWIGLWLWQASRSVSITSTRSTPIRVKSVLWIGLAAFAFSLFAVDWSRLDETDRFYAAVLDVMRRFLMAGLVTLGLGLLCVRDAEHREVDQRPAHWLAAGAFVGILAFLLQSSIDIAFFQPGPFMLCTLLMASLLGVTLPDRPRRRSGLTVVALVAVSLAILVSLAALVIPVVMAESSADYAQRLAPNQPERAAEQYRRAYDRAPVRNADFLLRAAAASAGYGPANLGETRTLLDRAVAANPRSVNALLTRAKVIAAIDPSNVAASLADYARAVKLNPNEIDLRIAYADLLERTGQQTEAAAQLAAALQTNDAYDAAEPERLELRSPQTLEQLRARLGALQQAQ